MSWADCAVGANCSAAPGSVYSDTYLTVDPGGSFADQVGGKLFLVRQGAELGLSGALVTPPNWGEGLHCLARLELTVAVDSTDPPVLASLVDEDTASIDWGTWGGGCSEPLIVDADPIFCGPLSGFDLYTEYVSTVPEDQDSDFRRDEDDNCVYKANADQSDLGGFMTTAKDGVGDACQCGDGDGTGQIWLDSAGSFDQENMLKYLRGDSPVGFAEDRCSLGGSATCTIYDAALLDQGLKDTTAVANECTAFTN